MPTRLPSGDYLFRPPAVFPLSQQVRPVGGTAIRPALRAAFPPAPVSPAEVPLIQASRLIDSGVPPVECTRSQAEESNAPAFTATIAGVPGDMPSGLVSPKHVGFTDLRMQLAARVHVQPEHLDRPELRGRSLASFNWHAGHRLSGVSSQDTTRDRYVVFTCLPQRITARPASYPTDGASITLLPICSQLPPTQLTATMRDDPRGLVVTPVDFRRVQGRVCTLPIAPHVRFQELVEQCSADCPHDRQAQQVYQLLANGRDPFVELRLGPGEPDYLQAVQCDLPPAELLELQPTSTSTTSPGPADYADPSDLELALQGVAGRSRPLLPAVLQNLDLRPTGLHLSAAFHVRVTAFRMIPALRVQRSDPSDSVSYTVFVAGHDPIRAQEHAHWTLQDYFRDGTNFAEASLHGMQLLMSSLPGLPTPQLVLSEGANIGNARTVPIDLRAHKQGVLPLLLRPGTSSSELIEQVVAGAPALRHDILNPLAQHRFFFRDAHGAVRTVLPEDIASVQWLELCHAPVPTGHIDPLALSVETHAGADDNAALLQVSISGLEVPGSHVVDRPLQAPGKDGPANEPPALLGRLVPSDIATLCAASVKVLPDYLSGEASMNKEVLLSSWGGREASETRHFTVFDVVHQIRVLDRGHKSTLQDCVALALQATSFPIAHLRVLTVPVPGLLLPQIVLHRAADPEPLDTLAVGQPIKTTVHRPGVLLAAALQYVDGIRPSPPGVYQPWFNGQVVALDALGVLGSALPDDFSMLSSMSGSSKPLPPERGHLHTTVTTTNMRAPPLPPGRFPQYHVAQVQALRLRVVRGFHAEETVVALPCAQVDRVLDSLVQKVATVTGALQPHNRLMIAKAQPFDNVAILEANFVISETPDLVVALCDTRHLGPAGTLASLTCPFSTSCADAVATVVQGTSCQICINGAPLSLCPRELEPGDYVQPGTADSFPLHVPTTVVLEACPLLEAYAYGLPLPVSLGARHRRAQAGFHRHEEGRCLILGPEHAPMAFRTKHVYVASHSEMREALVDLAGFPARDCAILGAGAQFRNERITARFVSIARGSTLSTVLLPACGWDDHFAVLLVPPRATSLGPLPIAPYLHVLPERRWQSGMVLRLCLTTTTTSTLHADTPELSTDPIAPATADNPASPSCTVGTHTQVMPTGSTDQVGVIPGLPVASDGPHPALLGEPTADGHTDAPTDGVSLLQRTASVLHMLGGQPDLDREYSKQASQTIASTEVPQGDVDAVEGGFLSTLPVSKPTSDPPCQQEAARVVSIPTPLGRRRFTLTTEDEKTPPTPLRSAAIHLDALIPVEKPSVAWAVCSDMVADCLAGHRLEGLCRDLSLLSREFHPYALAWTLLPPWDGRSTCEELLIYTDGSFFPGNPQATWSVIVLGRIGDRFFRIGFLADWVAIAQTETPSAYDGEVEALLHAMAVIGSSFSPRAHVFSDCASAILVADGAGGIDLANPACRSMVGLLIFARAKGVQVSVSKVPAHSGDAFNDMADAIAKQVGKSPSVSPWQTDLGGFKTAAAEHVLERLWMTQEAFATRIGIPLLSPTGTWMVSSSKPPATQPPASLVGLGTEETETSIRCLKLRVLQYNVLSLRGNTAKAMLSAGARRAGFDVACFQETRVQQSGFSSFEGWWILSASSTSAGVGGVQIWINPGTHLTWDHRELSILHASEQCLIVLSRVNGIDLAIVAGHAPPSVSPPEVLQAWWDAFSEAVSRIPRKYCLITSLDANARFECDPAAPRTLESSPLCGNARHLLDFACSTGGDVSAQCDCNGLPLVSWVSPNGQPALLDYITYPREWSEAVRMLPTPDLGDLHSGHDHWPVALELNVCCEGRKPRMDGRISPAQLRTPASLAAVQRALTTLPHIPWSVDSTTHVDIIHRHLHACLAELPAPPRKARNPALTNATVDLVIHKRHLQRCLKTARQPCKHEILWTFFTLWRGRPTDYGQRRRAIELAQDCEQRWVSRFKEAKLHLGQAMLQDKAAFARRGIQQAREAGPREFQHKLRAVLRCGRRFRAPSLVPVIKEPSATAIGRTAVLSAFTKHFAVPERATPVPLSQALAGPTRTQTPTGLDGEHIPGLVQLASAFSRLKTGKAAGVSGLPSEVFRVDPVSSACAFWPALLKAVLRDPFPFQWRGGAAVAVPKPGKASDELEGYRSVLLLEPSAKAVQVAYRPLLHDLFLGLRTSVHYGGVSGAPIALPAACARAHLMHLNANLSSGGAVFVDCKAAYYSVAREILSATPEQLTSATWLDQRAAIFFEEAADRTAFKEALQEHATAGALADRPELAAILRSQLGCTWFTGRAEAGHVMCAESGTMPGSPVADLLFGLVFHRLLHRVNECLANLGCQAFAAYCAAGETPPSEPTWADDVCILFQVRRPADLEPALQTIMQVVTLGMRRQGLEANLGRGKTECIAVIHGTGSQETRRRLLSSADPGVVFQGPTGPCRVRLVPTYTHLGCVLRADGNDLPAICHRERQAQSMYGPIRKKLLYNPYLTEPEKIQLLCSRVISSFMHGAGLLTLRSTAEKTKFTDVISRFYRGAFRPILSVSSTGYTNEEVATILGLALPHELLATARARVLADLCRAGLRPVLRCLHTDGEWWLSAVAAAIDVGLLQGQVANVDELLDAMPTSSREVSRLCRRFLRRCCAARTFDRRDLVAREDPDVPAVVRAEGPDLPWSCSLCPQAFAGRRQLAVHMSKHHGRRPTQIRCAFGTTCQKCKVEHWSLRRLTEHLRKSGQCRAVYAASDIDADPPAPTAHDYAWQPAVRVEGPSPWWATLTPPVSDEPS
ncbi:CACNA1S [Symbiodinium sp. CCMP2592]|nr:CACNA1S [Symbiodinium sp. CCMP2592]